MCGIIAYAGSKPAANVVLEGLKKLECSGGLAEFGHDGWAKTQVINTSSFLNFQYFTMATEMNILNFIDSATAYARISDAFQKRIGEELKNKNSIATKLKISNRTLRRIRSKSGYWCNLKNLFELSDVLAIEKSLLMMNIVGIKTKNSFPVELNNFELTASLARVLGHIIGDGGIHVNKKGRKYRVFYVNNAPELLNSFKSDIERLFKHIKIYYRERYKHGNEIWLPSTIGMIFYKLLDYQKLNNCKRVPQLIKDSNDERIICYFLQALYDDEGYLYPDKKMVVLAQVSKGLLTEIRDLVIKIGIKPNKMCIHNSKSRSLMHYFSITGKDNISKFRDKINFVHPVKSQKLKLLLKNYRR